LIASLIIGAPSFAQVSGTQSLDSEFEIRGLNNFSWHAAISKETNVVVGSTPTLITRPNDRSRLSFLVLDTSGSNGEIRLRLGDYRARDFDATADIDTTPLVETIDISGGVTPHEWVSGDGPYQIAGTCPAGLSAATNYYVEVVDADTIALHLTEAEALTALTATRVDLGVAAVGTCDLPDGPPAQTATTQDGYASLSMIALRIGGASSFAPITTISAPEQLTVEATLATTEIYYWWLP
jgi:hypothetical protein